MWRRSTRSKKGERIEEKNYDEHEEKEEKKGQDATEDESEKGAE